MKRLLWSRSEQGKRDCGQCFENEENTEFDVICVLDRPAQQINMSIESPLAIGSKEGCYRIAINGVQRE